MQGSCEKIVEQWPFMQGACDNMHRENWDDMRFVLAVAESGSVSAAARVLGVNHATVLRRIAAFEERHGGQIFERTPQGYTIPDDRQTVIEAAREVQAAVYSVERMIEGGQVPVKGVVRVTSTDTLCHTVLPWLLVDPPREATELRIELICSNSHLDLARLDADITVRPADVLSEGLTGEIAGLLAFNVYGQRHRPWLGMTGAIANSKPAQWLEQTVREEEFAAKADSFLTLREMVAAGLGKAILPTVLGDGDPRIEAVEMDFPQSPVPVWVACHPDMAEVPRIRAARTALLDAFKARAGGGIV
jgi:DNA-binding transcriptional LysR family regulator